MWVDEPFELNRYVAPIILPSPMHTAIGINRVKFYGMIAFNINDNGNYEIIMTGPAPVAGWGVEEEGADDLADKLKMTILQFIDDETCRVEIGAPEEILDSMICAYYKPGGRDSCQLVNDFKLNEIFLIVRIFRGCYMILGVTVAAL